MSERGYCVYPSGFARYDESLSDTILVSGDAEVDILFQHHLRGTKTSVDFDYFMKVVETAGRLLGGNADWLLVQGFNPNLNKQKLNFLVDTIVYLCTGRRSQSIRTWRAVCCDDGVKEAKAITRTGFAINKEIVLPKDIIFSEPSGIISTWLSYNDGFGDLVETLNVMFGTPDQALR